MQPTCDAATVAVAAFICANCARPGQTPDSAGRLRPTIPEFGWPFHVRQVLVPCSGRLQPEHVLKAFESGADLVVTVSCEKDRLPVPAGQRAMGAPGGLRAYHPRRGRAGW